MPTLFSVTPINPTDGTRKTLRFCNVDDPRVAGLNGEAWWPGVAKAPALNLEVFNGSFSTAVALAQASLSLQMLALTRHDPQAAFYRYAGAQVNVWYAKSIDAVWADYELIFAGLVTDHSVDTGMMQLGCTVDSEPFEEDLLAVKYAGTGGAEGPVDLKDKSKPAVFGFAQNIEPVMIDTVNNVFQVHAYGAIEDVVAVYERAYEFDPSVGDFADFAALVAADIPEGYWGSCKAQGMFRMGAPPFGLITADIKGDNVGGFHQTTASISQRLCNIAAVDAGRIDAASLAAFAASSPEPIDIYLTTPAALMDVLQELALPCNAQATLSWIGKLQFTRFGAMPGAATLTLEAQGKQKPPVMSNSELGVSTPYWRMEMQADRCWRVQSKDEIAFLDDDAPVTIYRRYPVKPDTPVGDDLPADWSLTSPGYIPPVNVSGFDQFGPIWQSTALQHAGLTSDAGWSEPIVLDVGYQGWTLVSQNTDAKVTGTANGLKATADFDPDADVWPYCFINRPIAGSWALKCKVKGALDRVAVGVLPFDPAVVDGEYNLDIKDGFYVAQADGYPLGWGGDLNTGVFIFQEYDPAAGFYHESDAWVLAVPVADCELEMIFNGETIEHYVNGEHVRTHFINNSLEALLTYWAVFVPLSPEAEIYDIHWVRATPARELDYRLDNARGLIRRMKDENGWEVYAPAVTGEVAVGYLYSKTFQGGTYVSAKIGAAGDDPAIYSVMMLETVGSIEFYGDGSFKLYKANGAFAPTLVDTGTWVAGDEFGISWDRKKVKWFKNGAKLHSRKKSSPPYSDFYLELGATAAFYDIQMTMKEEGELSLKGAVSTTALTTPVTDASPVVTAGYFDLGDTADLVFTVPDDSDTITVSAAINYIKTAGAAASFTPQVQLQTSSDSGVTWANLGAAVIGPASVATLQQVSVQASEAVNASGHRRYRLLCKNTVAGTFTATVSGSIVAEWAG